MLILSGKSIERIADRLVDRLRVIIQEGNKTMVDAVKDLTAGVDDALAELTTIVTQLEADILALANIPPDNTAAVEAQVAKLSAGVAAARAALNAPGPGASGPGPGPGPGATGASGATGPGASG